MLTRDQILREENANVLAREALRLYDENARLKELVEAAHECITNGGNFRQEYEAALKRLEEVE